MATKRSPAPGEADKLIAHQSRLLKAPRIAGHYANYSVFDVASVEELHDTLMQLPLFPYMDIEVDGLCRHPSSIHADDR